VKYFTKDNDYIYCNKCKTNNIPHKVKLIIDAVNEFEIEGKKLGKSTTLQIVIGSYMFFGCSNCNTQEKISNYYTIIHKDNNFYLEEQN
jgi:hypothetical protein